MNVRDSRPNSAKSSARPGSAKSTSSSVSNGLPPRRITRFMNGDGLPSGGGLGQAKSDAVSYEDLLIAQYLDELKKTQPYTKKEKRAPQSPYLQRLPHTNIVPTPGGIIRMGRSSQFPRKRPQSASTTSSSTMGQHSKPKIDAKFIADPDKWDPLTPRSEKSDVRKRRPRPASAPSSKYNRPYSASSYGSQRPSSAKPKKIKPLYKKQPHTIVCTAFKNGSRETFYKFAAPDLKQLLEMCTDKLGLGSAARRCFLDDGSEVFQGADIPREADVYISMGENFKNPYLPAKQHSQLKHGATWTMNGLILPPDQRRGKKKSILSKRFRNLIDKKKHRIVIFKNGTAGEGVEIVADLDRVDEFLVACTAKLELTSYARLLYDWEGNEIWDLHQTPILDDCLQTWTTPILGPLWVSKGEGFSPSGVRQFLTGLINFTKTRLRETKHYKTQLQYAESKDEAQLAKIEIPAILSMSDAEVKEALEMVQKDIDDFTEANHRLKDQLKRITDKVNEQEAKGNDYTQTHIREIEANDRIVGTKGLRLKVFENGLDEGETVIFFNLRDAARGLDGNRPKMMERLLDQLSNRTKNSPLKAYARRLFDKYGKEITDVYQLEYDQDIYISHGEPFKNPYTFTMQVTFDKTNAIEMDSEERGNYTTVFREQLNKEDVEGGRDKPNKWECTVGFPASFPTRNMSDINEVEQEHFKHLIEMSEVAQSAHYLQLKEDKSLVMYPEISVGYKQPALSTEVWPPNAQVWCIGKSGYIYSKAFPQLVLSVLDQEVKVQLSKRHNQSNNQYMTLEQQIQEEKQANEGDDEDDEERKKNMVEGFAVGVQKKMAGDPCQEWGFTAEGYIYSKGHPELVFTYLGGCYGDDESIAKNEIDGVPSGHRYFIAVCDKLSGKHAKNQRWAIKQERMDNIGQWKHSRHMVGADWNKKAYSWPVNDDDTWIEGFDWPMEGFFIPQVPLIRKMSEKKGPNGLVPLRLAVVKNGSKDYRNITPVVGPDLTNMMKDLNKTALNGKHPHKHNHKRTKSNENSGKSGDASEAQMCLHCNDMSLQQLEFMLFLERCTSLLDLSFAARRLFDETGKEHFTLGELQRDQIVYVSCGEPWSDPRMTKAEQQRRYLLANLAADIAQIRQFTALRNPENLVLAVDGSPAVGAKLVIMESVIEEEESEEEEEDPEEKKREEERKRQMEELLAEQQTSHEKAHQKSEQRLDGLRWPWERIANASFEEKDEDGCYTNRELYEKYKPKRQLSPRYPGLHLQKFIYEEGFIICKVKPELVLGVLESESRVAEVVLVKKRPDDIFQRWIVHDNGIIQAKHSPQMVLTVTMPTNTRREDDSMPLSYVGSTVILSNKKTTQFGRSNQIWRYDPETGFVHSFFTDITDKEVTSANKANVCTYSVAGAEELDQPGYIVQMADQNNKVHELIVCSACARAMRGRHKLEMLPHSVDFACAMGTAKDKGFKQIGSFQCLNGKVDLSTFEAEHTLEEWELQLENLRQETSVRAIAQEISAARGPKTVKVYAYKNGEGRLKEGELLFGSSILGILDQCTHRLQMASAARRIYTSDGMIILDIDDLIQWAVNNYTEMMRRDLRRTKEANMKNKKGKEDDEVSKASSDEDDEGDEEKDEMTGMLEKMKMDAREDDEASVTSMKSEMSMDGPMKSKEKKVKTEITFVNKSGIDANMFWVDYDGNRKKHGILPNGKTKKQRTYLTHVWAFEDANNTDTIFINGAKSHRVMEQNQTVLIQGKQKAWPSHRGIIEIYVTSVETPNNFICQLASTKQQLEMLVGQMTQLYEEKRTADLEEASTDSVREDDMTDDFSIVVDDMVAAKHEVGDDGVGLWFRAHVLSSDDYSAVVRYVDFGYVAEVEKKFIQPLKTEFLELPFQAITCSLAKVGPKGKRWEEDAISEFRELTSCDMPWPNGVQVVGAKTLTYMNPETKETPSIYILLPGEEREINIGEEFLAKNWAAIAKTPKAKPARPHRKNSISNVQPPPTEEILRYPIEVWASSGEPFVKPEAAEERYNRSVQEREERAKVGRELDKEKHVLRQMQGRRFDELNPGEYVGQRSPRDPVAIEGTWQEPSNEEKMKHDNIHQLETHLEEVRTNQGQKSKVFNPDTTNRLYGQPNMKRVMIFPNGESIKRAVYVWGESLQQLLNNATLRLNLRKDAKILYHILGHKIESFQDLERDQLIAVSYGKPFQKPKDYQQEIEIKANWGRARKQYGKGATEMAIDAQGNPIVNVDPFGPPPLANRPPPRNFHQTR
ncbi:unnamed protein product [Owenia fusiformis]|uniref:Uncharacterized protein n=1 Tax=Owenia fusiformis TaxID=6347 RepID=A0A8J1V1H8_OWEFU|nr:unnamed protein product [Owenia fusiformis]